MKIGFIGIGNMGGAILTGYAASPKSQKDDFFIYDKDLRRCEAVKRELRRVVICHNGRDVCGKADMVILGVKPQSICIVAKEIKTAINPEYLIVSMAAGVSIKELEGYFGKSAKVVRIIPNLPVKVSCGMISVTRNDNVSNEEMRIIMEILGTIGIVEEIHETLSDCVIGISGSSPAYTYMYIEALTQAAAENGMDADKARRTVARSVMDTAKAVLETSENLEELWKKEGISDEAIREGINELIKNGFTDSVKEGFQAAADRSAELTKEGRKK